MLTSGNSLLFPLPLCLPACASLLPPHPAPDDPAPHPTSSHLHPNNPAPDAWHPHPAPTPPPTPNAGHPHPLPDPRPGHPRRPGEGKGRARARWGQRQGPDAGKGQACSEALAVTPRLSTPPCPARPRPGLDRDSTGNVRLCMDSVCLSPFVLPINQHNQPLMQPNHQTARRWSRTTRGP